METPIIFTTLGALLLGGLAVEWAGRHLPLPRVTLLILFGVLIGPEVLDLLPDGASERWFEPVTTLALVMVGFLVGERFSIDRLRVRGRVVLTVSVIEALGTALLVTLGMLTLGVSLPIALLLGGIAPATAPASTWDVVDESRAEGPFTETLLGVVGVDDAWCLLIFSLAAAAAAVTFGGDSGQSAFMLEAAREIGGGILLGAVLGVAAGLLTQRIAPGEPTLLEAAAIVLLTAGLATLFELSFVLTAIVLGAVMTNVARHHDSAFHEIEHLEWPFMLLFFVLAGASLHIEALIGIGALGLAYVALRVIGKVVGAGLGARLAGAEPSVRHWTGLALMPQAGVALGLALLADQRFPELGETLLPLVIASTVVFEILGPSGTRLALARADEIGQRCSGR
jgi:Kef-type K+ transport system membrane component KefB